jgi:hypothetical protein
MTLLGSWGDKTSPSFVFFVNVKRLLGLCDDPPRQSLSEAPTDSLLRHMETMHTGSIENGVHVNKPGIESTQLLAGLTLRKLFSALMSWGADPGFDDLCRSKLGLDRPSSLVTIATRG